MPVTLETFRVVHVLSDAQIKTLNQTPFVVLDAPGAGKTIVPVRAIFSINKSAGAYTLNGNYRMQLVLDGSSSLIGGTMLEEMTEAYPLIANGDPENITMTLLQRFLRGGDGSLTSDFDNRALVLSCPDVGTTIGGGHPSNTLRLTLDYSLVDLA